MYMFFKSASHTINIIFTLVIFTDKPIVYFLGFFNLINNPAASYLATRSGALQLPVKTLRRLNKKLTQQVAGN